MANAILNLNNKLISAQPAAKDHHLQLCKGNLILQVAFWHLEVHQKTYCNIKGTPLQIY